MELACEFIPDREERVAFLNQTRQPQTERETPVLYLASSFDDEKQKLFDVLRERLLRNETVGILLPQNRQVFGFAKGLAEAGIAAEVPDTAKKTGLPAHDFSSDLPKLMTVYSAKGLTFDSVLIPRLVDGGFRQIRPERVGCSSSPLLGQPSGAISADAKKPLDAVVKKPLPLNGQHFTVQDGPQPFPKDEQATTHGSTHRSDATEPDQVLKFL